MPGANLLYLRHQKTADPPDLRCWNSNATIFNCSVSDLKTIKIVGLHEKDDNHKLVFNFVEFLLRNSRVLEKIVTVLAKCGACFAVEVSRKLLGLPANKC